jgi:hypothetical protein
LKKNAILLLLLVLCTSTLFAQSNRKISGTVTDTSKTSLSAVNIRLIAGKDTISTSTDEEGNFMFSKVNAETFSIQVSTIGYQKFSASYSFEKNEKHRRLPTIALKLSAEMLKEVVIKGKPNPVRFMQDTVEYNADAFQVRDGDNVADLLKQFPGIEVDENYGVKSMGQELVKLRVNGKDFFTNNVSEFINKLPAGIVAKIQVIDDFGDQANFTGIKVGEPTKMLNIVTKPGMNKGTFGAVSANAGTNDMVASNANMNFWNDIKQSGGAANFSTSDNGAGQSHNLGISGNYRDKIGKFANGGLSYNFSGNNTASFNEQVTETLDALGTFFTNSQGKGNNKNNSNRLNGSFDYNDKKLYLNGGIYAGYQSGENENSTFNAQTGVIHQDLRNVNRSNNKAPTIGVSFNLSKILKNKKNGFSANFNIGTLSNNNDQFISTNTLYYNKLTGVLEKDSLLNRNLISESNNFNFNASFNYSIGLKKPKDTLARQSLNINFSTGVNNSASKVSTIVFDNLSNRVSLVDSLSTQYHTVSISQSFGLNYNYSSKKMRYNFGINARPNFLTSNYIDLNERFVNNTFNFSPNANIGKTISAGKTISLNYAGYTNNPSQFQLQPIRNTQNLQNITIGNPDLKSSFSHSLNARYNYSNIKSGLSLQTGLALNSTQREIVNNVMLVPDTLNSLKQVTRFENVNGNYSFNGNYSLNIPLKKNKFSINYSGTLGFSNRIIFINNEKRSNEGLNFSQRIGGNIMLKKFSLNANLNYSRSNNSNSSQYGDFYDIQIAGLGQINEATIVKSSSLRADFNSTLKLAKISLKAGGNYSITKNNSILSPHTFGDIKSIDLNLSGNFKIRKTYSLGLASSKRFNQGYAFANSNPLLLSATLNKSFLKNNVLNFYLGGNDLLNQGNNISRTISGNTIVDRRYNQPTRVFALGLRYNLSNFGGKSIRIDQD